MSLWMTWVGSLGSQRQGTGGDRGGVRSRRRASRASMAPPTHPQLLASGSQGTRLWFFKPMNAWSFIKQPQGQIVTSFHLPSPHSASLEPGGHVGLPSILTLTQQPSSEPGDGPILHVLSASALAPWQWGTPGPSQGAATAVPEMEGQGAERWLGGRSQPESQCSRIQAIVLEIQPNW